MPIATVAMWLHIFYQMKCLSFDSILQHVASGNNLVYFNLSSPGKLLCEIDLLIQTRGSMGKCSIFKDKSASIHTYEESHIAEIKLCTQRTMSYGWLKPWLHNFIWGDLRVFRILFALQLMVIKPALSDSFLILLSSKVFAYGKVHHEWPYSNVFLSFCAIIFCKMYL